MLKIYQGKGPWVRLRSVPNVIQEMVSVKKNYGFKWIQINDDTFNADYEWLFEFLKEYRRHVAVPFICNLRADTVKEDVIKALKEAGCDRINIGVEQGDETLRKEVLKRAISNEQLVQVGRWVNKYGIRLFTANMIGFPGEDFAKAMETVKINRQFNVEYPSCCVLQPYPNTEIFDILVEKGLIDKNFNPDDLLSPHALFTNSCKKVGSVIKQPNIDELTNMGALFYYFVKFPWLTGLLRLLIKLPPNRFFSFLWQIPILKIRIRYAQGLQAKRYIFKQFFAPLIQVKSQRF